MKDAELKGKGKGKFGKGNNKGKGQVKGSDFKGSGKMGSFSNNGYTWNGGYKGKGGKNAGKGWNGVWEEDVWEDGSGAQTMQLFGVTEDHEKVMNNSWTTLTTASAHAGRKDPVVPSAPPGLQLQNRFGELVVEEDHNDEEDGIPIMALFSPETEINHLKARTTVGEAGDSGGFRSCRVRCSSADGTMGAKTGVRGIQAEPDLSVGEWRKVAEHGREEVRHGHL